MMNAILVFDPTNDLLFVKSNRLFKKSVYKYSRSNGLLSPQSGNKTDYRSNRNKTNAPPTTSSDSSASTSTSRSSSSFSSQLDHNGQAKQLNFKRFAKLKRRPAKRRTRNSLATDIDQASDEESPPDAPRVAGGSRRWEDSSKSFIDVLMLMLTPYVASLRLSTNLSSELDKFKQDDPTARLSTAKTKSRVNIANSSANLAPNIMTRDDDLLAKFMSSINLNHECRTLDTSNEYDGTDCDDQGDDFINNSQTDHQMNRVAPEDSMSKLANGDYCEDFAPRKFATSQVPIECLKDCQIVYCELYDFIFIYMQELELVSSFKMRLLQKRIDIFARLSLLLLGPSLNSIRYHENPNQSNYSPLPIVNQAKILRLAYDVWLEHQFEPHFLLEANERLILGKHIRGLAREALKKISIQLRSASLLPTLATTPAASLTSLANTTSSRVNLTGAILSQSNYSSETHMHTLLYSGEKLVSQFSCRNSQPLNADDLILLLLLLKTFNLHYDNTISDEAENNDDDDDDFLSESSFKVPDYCYKSHYNADRNTQKIKVLLTKSSAGNSSSSMTNTTHSNRSLGANSLSTRSSSVNQKYDKSARKSKLPTQFPIFLSTGGKFHERLRVPHMLRFIKLTQGVTLILISEISSISYLCLQLHRVLRICHEFTRFSSQIKLSQLSRMNDCVAAIKTYFHNPSLEFKLRASLSATSACQPDLAEEAEEEDYIEVGGEGDDKKESAGGVLGSLFGKYLGKKPSTSTQNINRKQQSGYIHQFKRIENQFSRLSLFNSLTEDERRQCCQLICRLDDLISSNLHTYMRQTFNLPVVEHKRDALLTCVSATLRDSIDTFILQPQLKKLNEPWNLEQRQVLDLMDEIKLMARMELSDYLDYLAIKSTCNVTLGAPLTHDMLAIRSFIYIDRSRQELLVSPMKHDDKLSRDSLLEGDYFFDTISREMDGGDQSDASSGQSSGGSSGGGGDSQPERSSSNEDEGRQSDDSTKSSSVSSAQSVICVSDLRAGKVPNVTGNNKAAGLPRFQVDQSKQRAGSSGSLVMTNSSAATTTSDLQLSSNLSALATSQADLNLGEQRQFSSLRSELELNSNDETMKHQSVCENLQLQQQQPRLVDEKLMKGFNCFIYNRLAQGQTSYISSSDESGSSSLSDNNIIRGNDSSPRKSEAGTGSKDANPSADTANGYVYSYFLWFKRQTVRSPDSNCIKTLPCPLPEVIYSHLPRNDDDDADDDHSEDAASRSRELRFPKLPSNI